LEGSGKRTNVVGRLSNDTTTKRRQGETTVVGEKENRNKERKTETRKGKEKRGTRQEETRQRETETARYQSQRMGAMGRGGGKRRKKVVDRGGVPVKVQGEKEKSEKEKKSRQWESA
jgi:hypothetical protein